MDRNKPPVHETMGETQSHYAEVKKPDTIYENLFMFLIFLITT